MELNVNLKGIIEMNRHTGIDFENYVAKYYFNKHSACQQNGTEFSVTLPEVRRMLSSKFCAYTGMPLTHQYVGAKDTRYTDVTIDRIDNSKGYVKGNVKAVAHGINQLKSLTENTNNAVTINHIKKFGNTVQKLMKGKK